MVKLMLLIVALSSLALGQTDDEKVEVKPPNPKLALLAGLVPGGGQLYNRRWIKAIIIAGAEAYYIRQWEINRSNYRDCVETSGISCGGYLERRNKFAWWVGIYYVMGMVDAYVDAHLITFPTDTVETATDLPITQIQELQ